MVEPLTSGQPGNHSACSSACSRLLASLLQHLQVCAAKGTTWFQPQFCTTSSGTNMDQSYQQMSFIGQKTRPFTIHMFIAWKSWHQVHGKKKYQHILSSFLVMGHEYGSTFNTQKATLLPTHPLFEELQQFLLVPNVLAKSRQVTQIFETLVDAPFSCLSRLGWAGTREEMVPEAKVRLKIYVKKAKYPQTSESRGVGGLRFISSCKTCESFFEVLPFASGLWSASEVVVIFPSKFC